MDDFFFISTVSTLDSHLRCIAFHRTDTLLLVKGVGSCLQGTYQKRLQNLN